MKKLGFLILVVAFQSTGAWAETTYPLKCRPGPNTGFNISVEGDLRFGFARGSVGAGNDGSGLQPGQCAWVDRAVSASEPAFFAAALSPTFKVGAVVPHVENNSFKAYIYAATQQWVMNFQQKDVILTINVYNDGNFLRAPNP